MGYSSKHPAKAYDAKGRHVGPGPWLDLIRAANGVEPGFFGEPIELGLWWAGGSFEEYEHARVIHHSPSEAVSVVAKTDHGAEVLLAAEKALGATSRSV